MKPAAALYTLFVHAHEKELIELAGDEEGVTHFNDWRKNWLEDWLNDWPDLPPPPTPAK